MDFKVLSINSIKSDYALLWMQQKKRGQGFMGPDLFFQKIVTGQLKILNKNFKLKVVGLFEDNKPVILCTYFSAKNSRFKDCLGLFVTIPKVTKRQIDIFWNQCNDFLNGKKVIAPLNGHHYLGFGLLTEVSDFKKVGVFLPGTTKELRDLFKNKKNLSLYRTYYAFETLVTEELKSKLEHELQGMPDNFKVLPFSKLRFARDYKIMNQLVNKSFKSHFDFIPLTDEENLDLIKWNLPIINKDLFLFLYDKNKPIGFCMGILDYNQVSKNKQSDAKNMFDMMYFKSKIKRARLIHIGLLPKYQGRGLVKYLRHQVLLNMINRGVKVIENSVIDQDNVASQGNVKSTGGKMIHKFEVFCLNG